MAEGRLQHFVPDLAINLINIPKQDRTLSRSLGALKDSLAREGMLHPLHVKMVGNKVELLSGYKRLTAAKELGWQTVPVLISFYGEQTELKHAMAVIDENVCREALTCLEFAEALGRSKEIYETCYPETKHGGRKQKAQDPENGSSRPAFVDDMASKLGQSRSSLSDYLYVYKHTTQEVRDLIRHSLVANFFKDLHAFAKERQHQLTLAHILHEHPHCTLWQARQLLNAHTAPPNDEDHIIATTEPGELGEIPIPPQYEEGATTGGMRVFCGVDRDGWPAIEADDIVNDYIRVEEGHTIKVHQHEIVIVLKKRFNPSFRIYEMKPELLGEKNRIEETWQINLHVTRERSAYDG